MAFVIERTICATLLERTRRTPSAIAFSYRTKDDSRAPKGSWRKVTFLEFAEECERLSLSLKKLGLMAGDRVAILSKTRYEWTLADFAILANRAITTTIHPAFSDSDVLKLLSHSESRMAFVENEKQLMRILPHLESLPHLERIILFDNERNSSPNRTSTLVDLLDAGFAEKERDPGFFESNFESVSPEEEFTLCYTSGTTGDPKGVLLSHRSLMSVLADCASIFEGRVREGKESLLTFLPFSHIIGRVESMSPFVFGWTLNFADSTDRLAENLKEVRPTILFAVPRIFEKAYIDIENRLEDSPIVIRSALRAALGVGSRLYSKRRRGKRPGFIDRASFRLFRETLLKRVLEGFGGRLRFAICGGAPLSKTVGERFEKLGILILEGYGLTETCAPVALNSIENHRFGTVGRPLPEVTIRIAEDGEILLRTNKLFTRYWKDEVATRDSFDEEGWFKTGDIGFIDPQGYLHITDRKKDVIITSGGKNITPQRIEALAKTVSPLISEFVVVGDRRKHLAALLTLDPAALERFAKENHLLYSGVLELTRHPLVQSEVEKAVASLNQNLSRFETIHKFAILPTSFSVESGELTPLFKLRRAYIQRQYRAVIDSLYHDPLL